MAKTHWKFYFTDINGKKVVRRFTKSTAGEKHAIKHRYDIEWAVELPGPIPKNV